MHQLNRAKRASRGWIHKITAAAIIASTFAVVQLGVAAPPVSAAVAPILESGDGHVTADALPTVQINGVVWDQEIIGNTVYAVGEFSSARPYGSALGQNETPRSNILAYNLTTGALITTFAPTLNAQVKTVAKSPDGSRLYVGGDFTSVGTPLGTFARSKIAALNPTTGNLIPGFNAIVGYQVGDIVATNTTVYAGGAFGTAGPDPDVRNRLAAFNASNGALLTWAPSADAPIQAMVLSPDGTKLIVGGTFENLNGVPAYGMGAIDAQSGATLPWAANAVVRDARSSAAILSLSTDGTSIFGSGYTFGRDDGNLEGVFSANPDTGAVNWIEDCHGDTYDQVPMNGNVYTASHAHYCGNVGGFPQSENWAVNMRHALSFSTEARGTVRREPWGYTNWEGYPAPALENWFPEWGIGTYTGQDQATWSVNANSQYLVYGGEFTRINGQQQQGLTRFAVKPIAPSKSGMRIGWDTWPINVQSTNPGQVRISFPANYDRDDGDINYRITRNGQTIYNTTARSTFWDRPIVSYTDTTVTPGATYNYVVWATDNDNNAAATNQYPITVPTTGTASPYSDAVMNDGARLHWRLGDAAGSTTVKDAVGLENGVVHAPVTFGAAGAINGETNTAATFSNNISSTIYSPTKIESRDTFTMEAWVRTSTGGRIMGFSSNNTGSSGSSMDRVLYMASGRIYFGVRTKVEGVGPGAGNSNRLIQSPTNTLNNNQWHHVVASLGTDGMHLYIDGVHVASRGDTMTGAAQYGYWRVGADNLNGWTPRPSTDPFVGSIDEAAVYYSVLTPATVANHYRLSGRTPGVVAPPADTYGAAIQAADPSLYYRLGESTGTVANDSGIRVNTGDYVGASTKSQQGRIVGNAAVRFTGSGFVANRASTYAPGPYSVETWFRTNTTTGGKLIGFGSSATGNSVNYDRHVYMRDDGRLVFGAGSVSIQSSSAFNNDQWHHVVATQGPAGMQLYVDGGLVGSNPSQVARAYTGFWRIGGDTTPPGGGSTANNFTGLLDEAAVYDRQLSASEVLSHLTLGGGQLANVAPTAEFTVGGSFLDLTVDSVGSVDPDGTIVSYEWDFGDGDTATGPTAAHTYDDAGTFDVTLLVRDNRGDVATVTHPVTVATQPANINPTANFGTQVNAMKVDLNASASVDPDGTIQSYAWDFGDGTTESNPTALASHTYLTAGTKTITLTVTDNRGGIAQDTHQVSVAPPPNVAPTAAFASQVTGLKVDVNSVGTVDPDGTITGYAWDFGDGATSTDPTASHTYLTAGTKTITLTVTDNQGSTGVASAQVTVSTGPQVVAYDGFGRTATNGWGTADTGGAWTPSGGPSTFSVTGGVGRISLASTGTVRSATLNSTSVLDVDETAQFTLDKAPTANGNFVGIEARRVGTTEFRARVRVRPGRTDLELIRAVNGVETTLASQILAGIDYTAGTVINLRFRVTGTGTTVLATKAWFGNAPEPANFSLQLNDTTAALQSAGAVGINVSTSSTNTPVLVTLDEFRVYNGAVVAPPTNLAPTAMIGTQVTNLKVDVNSVGSNDPDGAITGYAWDFGDGATSTAPTASHTYLTAGTKTITLTVTDNQGSTGVATTQVNVVAPPNVAPHAAFTTQITNLKVDVDGTISTDSDGTIPGYEWDFGDGATSTDPIASHVYGASGNYTITLLVRDNQNSTSVATTPVSVTAAPNVAPTAAITTQVTNLKVDVNSVGSVDPDGTITGYAWDFGDGATSTDPTASHTYLTAGTKTITLTVTDNQGSTGVASAQVTVVTPPVAEDAFARTATNGWGTADTGGAWTPSGGPSTFSVTGGVGRISLASTGTVRSATLNSTSVLDVDETAQFTLDKAPTTNGNFVGIEARRVGTTEFRARVRVRPGRTDLELIRAVNGVETTLASQILAGIDYTAGTVINLRFRVTGTGTTVLATKAWFGNAPEPANFSLTLNDTTAALQSAGAVGINVSTSSTNTPVLVTLDNFVARPV